MAEAQNLARLGDVFIFPLERIGRFGACQVVATDETEALATVAVLAWTGAAEPDITELASAPRMVRDFMFWTPEEMLTNVPLAAPVSHHRIGTLPVSGETTSRSYSSWDFASIIERQYRWNLVAEERTAAFRAATNGTETAIIPGLSWPSTGEPYKARLSAARSFSDEAGYRIGEDFRMESLHNWPALYQLTLNAWRDDLVPFLESSPLAKELTLTGHGQSELDFSRTALDTLSLDITGLERLALPPSMDTLILRGKGAVAQSDSLDELLDELSTGEPSIPAALQVTADEDGRWISVHLTGTVPPVHGLERTRGLRIGAIDALDVSDIVEHFPHVSWLHLFGAPGVLENVSELHNVDRVETLWICDLFGYEPEDFPAPDLLPTLTSLDLDSVPADVASSVRAAYKKAPRVELTVRRPRKPEWMAENLENPLRRWDGREGIPVATAKKASAAFVAALRQVREADASHTDETSYTQIVTEAVTQFLDAIAALNRKRQFLYTLERDEVIDAVDSLTAALSPEANRALEQLVEDALDD